MNVSEDLRKELQRGIILQFLILMNLEFVPVREVRTQLIGQGYAVDDKSLAFHLNYMEQKGYIERRNLRAGRSGLEVQVARATAKGADLADGRIEPDEGVRF
jgi:repressor of nif and glnA expression